MLSIRNSPVDDVMVPETNDESLIFFNATVVNSNGVSKLQIEAKGNQGITNVQVPMTVQTGPNAPWYLMIVTTDQFELNTQGIRITLKPIEQFSTNPSYGFNETSVLAKPSSVPYFFSSYANSSTMRGELRFGGVGTVDIAWFHGYDYKLEEGEQLRREATNSWVRTWYENDL